MKYKGECKNGFTNPAAVARRCSVKRVFLKFSQSSQENTYSRVFTRFSGKKRP